MANPYETLGVSQDATQKEIQSAYRKLAKKLHPDLNPGDASAEEKFKAASAAYAILGDEDKRARFDRHEIDETGGEQGKRSYYRDYASGEHSRSRYHNPGGFADFGDRDDIFSSFFSGAGGRGTAPYPGDNTHYRLELELREAANGAKRTVSLPEGGTLELKIPAGARDGQILRLREKAPLGTITDPRATPSSRSTFFLTASSLLREMMSGLTCRFPFGRPFWVERSKSPPCRGRCP